MSRHFSLNAVVILLSAILFLSAESDHSPPFSCDPSNPSTKSLPFCNAQLPVGSRAKDLVSRLTLDEKVQQLVNTAAAVPRLNISAYEWWSEALHGVSRHGKGVTFNSTVTAATMFPQVILAAASFDSQLWYRIAEAIGDEARAVFNVGQAKGMTFWAPNINIFRTRGGGEGKKHLEKTLLSPENTEWPMSGEFRGTATAAGSSGTATSKSRRVANTTLPMIWTTGTALLVTFLMQSKQDLADTYQPPFRACVEQGQASGIMCAYNRVNGVPTCADYDLLTKTARQQWGFQGYIASDCDAVAIIHDQQGYAKEPEDAVADVLKAGMDVNCGSYLKKYTRSAVAKKKVSESDIDRALENLFSVRMRLGLFNGDPRNLPYGDIDPSQVCSQNHFDLALEAAKSGIVLLKNDLGLLPFSRAETKSLAVIGPNANDSGVFVGNYEGLPCKKITILEALEQYYVNSTKYHQGCDFVNCTSAFTDEAVETAKQADYVVLVMGLDQTLEREKHDRVELGLPGKQESLVASVAEAAKRPVVLVLLCGGPVDVSFAKENPKIGSILWAGYPGEAGGVAVAQTLFGDHNPGGRLPVTWYPKDFIKVPMTDMRMRADPSTGYPGRTYRFYNGPKVYEFGRGLSYANYSYKFVSVSQNTLFLNNSLHENTVRQSGSVPFVPVAELGTQSCNRMMFSAQVRVHNPGEMSGKHPVLLFVRIENAGRGKAMKKLVGFRSVSLSPGETKEIAFVVNPCRDLSYADEDGVMLIEEGKLYLVVGDEDYPVNVVV
ncbi:UNVERIFIED_CONTAM: putative beta-D-xylosidase 7 [Sesamum latifolium]|uniref:Beta-D-xylosidase 7 n=1 Tax=Sesamum latifolium TaxID=2727402 RepID=A0AAW2VUZ1_9LAMI